MSQGRLITEQCMTSGPDVIHCSNKSTLRHYSCVDLKTMLLQIYYIFGCNINIKFANGMTVLSSVTLRCVLCTGFISLGDLNFNLSIWNRISTYRYRV